MKIILPVKNNPDKILKDVRKKLSDKGGSLSGELNNGIFSVLGINGEYKIVEQELIITIISKPFFIPYSMIEIQINEYFKQCS